ncbi:MAG: hypothetical protein UHK60_04110 [Acutalibacteraceae bacterium]|nr:hypothetical protein [Acutalibacteraceae bacterium]
MAIYRIADMRIKYETKSSYILQRLRPYIIEDKEYDYEVIVSEDDINYERSLTEDIGINMLESAALFRHICKNVLESYNGIFLHCAALKYNGKAYLFTAPSGTGKTTHIRLWMKNLGDRVEVINGDKPILRKKGDNIIVYGTPWQGKENYGSNISATLGGVFLLDRGTENSVEKATVKDSISFLLSQTLRPYEKENMIKLFEIIECVVKNIPIYHLKCNMENQAVKTALSVIDK